MSAQPAPRAPRRQTGAALESGRHGAVLLRTRSGAALVNPTALALWELCDGTTTVEEMVTAVCTLFGIDVGRARSDVSTALDQMTEAGLIE